MPQTQTIKRESETAVSEAVASKILSDSVSYERALGRVEGAQASLEQRINRTDASIIELKSELNGKFSNMERSVDEKINGLTTSMNQGFSQQKMALDLLLNQNSTQVAKTSVWTGIFGSAGQIILAAISGGALMHWLFPGSK